MLHTACFRISAALEIFHPAVRTINSISVLSVSAGGLAYERHTVGALGNGGVCLVCADLDGFERAVMLGCEIVLAACYIAFNGSVLGHKNLPL